MDKFSPFYRQMLVAVTSHLGGLSIGALTAYPIVLLQQMPSDPNLSMDLDNTSWIASVQGISGILSIIMTPIMQWRGRRFAFIISMLIIMTGWTLITFANDATAMIIGESFHGLGCNSVIIVSLVSVSEMIDPKHRCLSMLLFGLTQEVGSILVTILGNFLHYKTVAKVMFVPCVLSLILSFMWPDSPSWLACRGDFERCEQIFTWLRGSGHDSQKELAALITAQKEVVKEKALKKKKEKRSYMRKFFNKITRRDCYLPMACMWLIISTFYGSGALVFFMYGTTLAQSLTGIINPLIPLAVFVIALGVSSALAIVIERYSKNKQIFLIGGMASTFFLLLSCIVIYLHSVKVLKEGSTLFLYCFFGLMVSNAAGLCPTVFNVSAELIPVKHRGLGSAIYLITMCVCHTASVKSAPYLFLYLDVWGTCILYLFLAVFGYFLIWKYIPETKHRTLQEIEDYFNYGEFKKVVKDECSVNVPIMTSE